MAIHSMAAEIFQSQSKWWAAQCIYSTGNALASPVCWKVLWAPRNAFICGVPINSITSKNTSEKYAGQTSISLSLLSVISDIKYFRIAWCWNSWLFFCSATAQLVPPFSGCSPSGSDRPFGLWTMAECTWPHAKRKVNCLSVAGNESVLSSQYRSLSTSWLNTSPLSPLEMSLVFGVRYSLVVAVKLLLFALTWM